MTHDSKDLWHNIKIARPCKVSWDSMSGDEQVRHCSKCAKNVFNISNMTQEDAAALIKEKEGDLCLRLYRRADGTIITRNCPLPAYMPWLIGLNAAGAALLVALFVTGQASQGQMECHIDRQGEIMSSKVHLVYACSDIEPGATIQAGHLEERDVLPSKVPPRCFFRLADVAGKRASRKIPAGAILTEDSLQ